MGFVLALLAPALFDFFPSWLLCWNSLTCCQLSVLEKVVPHGSNHCFILLSVFESLAPARPTS